MQSDMSSNISSLTSPIKKLFGYSSDSAIIAQPIVSTPEPVATSFKDIVFQSASKSKAYAGAVGQKFKESIGFLLSPSSYIQLTKNSIFSSVNAIVDFIMRTFNNPLFIFSILAAITILTAICTGLYIRRRILLPNSSENGKESLFVAIRNLFWLNIVSSIVCACSIVFNNQNATYSLLASYKCNYIIGLMSLIYCVYFGYTFRSNDNLKFHFMSRKEITNSSIIIIASSITYTLLFPLIIKLDNTIALSCTSILSVVGLFSGFNFLVNKLNK